VASDQSADGWITFSQPFEANQLSLVGATLRHNWLNSLFVGIFLLVWALLGLVSRQTRVVAVAK
jgi:hypothetical protein